VVFLFPSYTALEIAQSELSLGEEWEVKQLPSKSLLLRQGKDTLHNTNGLKRFYKKLTAF